LPKQSLPQRQQYRTPSHSLVDQDGASNPQQQVYTPISSVSSLCEHDSPSALCPPPSVTASYIDYNTFGGPLPVLLYSLGGSQVRQDILFRGLMRQKQWDIGGNEHEITLDAGFDNQIISLFLSKSQLEQEIKSCIRHGSIKRSGLEHHILSYSISNRSWSVISQSINLEKLRLLGLMFIIHIYPQDKTLEPS
jgi:hypothetical protein